MKLMDYSEALEALKEGRILRRNVWDDEFVVLTGAVEVPVDKVADTGVRDILTAAGLTVFVQDDSFRKFDIRTCYCTLGWQPSAEDILSGDWVDYDPEEMRRHRQFLQLRSAVFSGADLDTLRKLVSEILTDLEHDYATAHTAGSDSFSMDLTTEGYEGISVMVSSRGVSVILSAADGNAALEVNNAIHLATAIPFAKHHKDNPPAPPRGAPVADKDGSDG